MYAQTKIPILGYWFLLNQAFLLHQLFLRSILLPPVIGVIGYVAYCSILLVIFSVCAECHMLVLVTGFD